MTIGAYYYITTGSPAKAGSADREKEEEQTCEPPTFPPLNAVHTDLAAMQSMAVAARWNHIKKPVRSGYRSSRAGSRVSSLESAQTRAKRDKTR